MVLLPHTLLRNYLKFSLLTVSLLLCFTSSFAQSYLEVPVKLDIEKGNMEGVLVKVKKDGKDAFTQSGSSKMRFKLDFNKKYTLIFTKDGYITKTIEFDTHASTERIKSGFEPYTIGVKLFNQENEDHTIVYNQAVGLIKFDPVLDEFNFDTDYSKSILSEVKDQAETPSAEWTQKTNDETAASDQPKKDNDKSSDKSSRKNNKDDDATKQNSNVTPDSKPTAKGSGNMANDVRPVANGNGGNDVKPTPSGNGGNDNSNLIAMADGADPGSGIDASSGNDTSPKSTGRSGSEMPAVTQMPTYGIETNNRQMPAESGSENLNSAEIYESQSITREDVVEDKKIITIVRVTKRNTTIEYRRVTYRWGGPYYFVDNRRSISETVFAHLTGVKD
jgi:hypothetical protein